METNNEKNERICGNCKFSRKAWFNDEGIFCIPDDKGHGRYCLKTKPGCKLFEKKESLDK